LRDAHSQIVMIGATPIPHDLPLADLAAQASAGPVGFAIKNLPLQFERARNLSEFAGFLKDNLDM
jgi:hypothetical protein